MTDCLFCQIAAHQIPADIVYEDEDVVAFLDIRPTSQGHTLVIPKAHSETLLAAADQTLAGILPKIKKIAAGVVAATGAAGFNLGCNTGAAAGQIIFHLHFHIIPRYENDGLVPWGHHESDGKARAELAAKIAERLRN